MKKLFVLPVIIGICLFAMTAQPAKAAKLFAVSSEYEPSNAKIYRYDIKGPDDHPTAPDLVLKVGEWPTNSPVALAFSPWGEMFVFDRGPGGNGYGAGSVHRYRAPLGQAPVFNGSIDSNGQFSFKTPHFGSFRGNELFLAQRFDEVQRFVVKPNGTAEYNGSITQGIPAGDGVRGVKVSPWGELFVSIYNTGEIRRYLIAPDGSAVPNGVITDLYGVHDLAFNASGEMFVPLGGYGKIRRYTFENGVATFNSEIYNSENPEVLYNAIGITIAPWDELFVSNHLKNEISRWVKQTDGGYRFNGVITTPDDGPTIGYMGRVVLGLGGVEFINPNGLK